MLEVLNGGILLARNHTGMVSYPLDFKEQVDDKKKPFSRLPTTVKPVHYVVKVKPDLKKFSFTGSVEIQLDVNQSTDELVFNAAELQIRCDDCKCFHFLS